MATERKFELRSYSQTGMGYVIPQAWSNADSCRQARMAHPRNGLSNCVYSSNTLYSTHHTNDGDDEDNFTFSRVADSLGFFSISSCTGEAENTCTSSAAGAGPFSMSPAEELFEDGKIRPLIAHNQSNHIPKRPSINLPHPDYENRLMGTHQALDKEGKTINESTVHNENTINPFDQGYELDVSTGYDGFPSNGKAISAPASPLCSISYSEISSQQERDQIYPSPYPASTTIVNSYKRSRSLSRVYHVKDDERVLKLQVEEGIKEALHHRKTLEDLLKQEEIPTINPRKTGVPANMPEPWQKREKLLAANATNNVVEKRSMASPQGHYHYASKRTQAERMKKKTFLPYRLGLLGCLGYQQ